MYKLKVVFLSTLLFTIFGFKSDKPAYAIFSKDGKQVKYQNMLSELEKADIVFFGEQHNNPICHWLQFEISKDLEKLKGSDLVLGAEMFETDNQIILDEYLNGSIKQSSFEKEARLWPNYKTDYKPLVELAKDSGLRFIATNIPRRYASFVHSNGLDDLENLSAEAKKYIAQLPIDYDSNLPGYKAMLDMMKDSPHVNENLPKAQAAKDATMAEFILKNWTKGKLFLHYNGAYHSDDFEGIVWYLQKTNPNLKIVTISSVEQISVESLDQEFLNKADYILVVPESMTKTY